MYKRQAPDTGQPDRHSAQRQSGQQQPCEHHHAGSAADGCHGGNFLPCRSVECEGGAAGDTGDGRGCAEGQRAAGVRVGAWQFQRTAGRQVLVPPGGFLEGEMARHGGVQAETGREWH